MKRMTETDWALRLQFATEELERVAAAVKAADNRLLMMPLARPAAS